MPVEDILKKANDRKHLDDANDLQTHVLESRIPLLTKYYAMGLDDAEREAFDAKSPIDQISELQDKKYVIKKEHAEQLVADIGVYILKKHDKLLGEQLEDAVKKRFDPKSSYDEKHAAEHTIGLHKATLIQLGFDWDTLIRDGAEKGFTERLYQENTGKVGPSYRAFITQSHLNMIDRDDANKYLDKIGKAVGLNTDLIKGKGPNEVLGVISAHYQAKKENDLDSFKKNFHYYLKK